MALSAGVEHVNLSLGHIAAIGLRLRELEREVVLPQITIRRGCVSRIHACHLGQASTLVR